MNCILNAKFRNNRIERSIKNYFYPSLNILSIPLNNKCIFKSTIKN